MKEYYIYLAVIIIWSSFLTYIDIDSDSIYRSSITLFFVFGLKQLIEIKNNTR
jgi:hypothetical protein